MNVEDLTKKRYYEIGDASWTEWQVIAIKRGVVELMSSKLMPALFKTVNIEDFTHDYAYNDC